MSPITERTSDAIGADTFESCRPFLFGLAYRLLGTRAEAEDAVQETYLKWQAADAATLDNPRAWLTSVCTRHCLDLLRSAQRRRVEYVGTWLPEPIHPSEESSPEAEAELSSSLSMAFLLLLERLAPKERAAYLLHEVFALSYSEIAQILGTNEAACRKLVSRACSSIGRERTGYAPSRERQLLLLDAFRNAITGGEIEPLAQLLAQDVTLRADGGGKVPTLRETLRGRAAVLGFVAESLRTYWQRYEWRETDLNGARGVVLREDAQTAAAVSFSWNAQGEVDGIYIVRNPDKLSRLALS